MGGIDVTKSTITARIGMVNFINTAPLYEVWKRTVERPDWQVTEAVPSVLNTMLHNRELDLGFISSHEYALHPDKYRLLSDLSISATGAVGSVFLFSKKPLEELDSDRVLLSSQSQTSAYLVRIILEDFYGISPDYTTGLIAKHSSLDPFAGVLAIGDEALRISGSGDFPVETDLSRVWNQQTGLPFVFAVWAAREEFCKEHPDAVTEIHGELLRCLEEGRKDLRSISSLVAPRIPMPFEECFNYLSGIEYDLDTKKRQGLSLFCEYLAKRGEGRKDALPLKIFV
jgi:chorismate dehydratase